MSQHDGIAGQQSGNQRIDTGQQREIPGCDNQGHAMRFTDVCLQPFVSGRVDFFFDVSAAAADAGPTVCACFGVPLNMIEAAISAGATTPEAIGAATKAGTNCGSCLPELRRMTRERAPA